MPVTCEIGSKSELEGVFHHRLAYLEASFGKSPLCENTGPSHPGETLVAQEFADATGWKGRGYVYEAKDVPAGDAHFILKVDLPR
jgi:hypothetical protein